MNRALSRLLSIFSFCAISVHALASATPISSQPIKMVVNDWTSQIVLSKIVGSIFEQTGHKVEYVTLSTNKQWGALARGLAHVQVEVWEGTMSEMFNRMVAEAAIVDMGSYRAQTREEWWYPAYVAELCPGLPDWKALRDCAALFAVAGTAPQGRYVAGPWEKPDEARIRALGLNFIPVKVKHGDELWVELARAEKAGEPIVLFNWSPNWVEAVYDGAFVEFPAFAPDCETDPAWGINPKFLYDCGNPTGGWLKKAAWAGMATSWPMAHKILAAIDLSNAEFAQLAAMVDVDGLSHDEAASLWLAEHEQLWRTWIPKNQQADAHHP